MVGMLVLLVALCGGMVACANGKVVAGNGNSGQPGTTKGIYTVTVVGTSGSTTSTGTFTLTVQ
jgi:hypothetical protein